MRVSSNNFIQTSLRQLQVLQEQQNTQQTQLATGQKINSIQDDTLTATKVLRNQELQKELAQYKNNAGEADAIAQISYDNLSYLEDLVNATQDLTENEAFEGRPELFIDQINGYIDDALSVANSLHDGEYLFGGTDTGNEPFVKVDAYGIPVGQQAVADADGDGIADDLDGDGVDDLLTDANGDPVYVTEEDAVAIQYVGADDDGRGFNVSEGVNIQPFASLETSESIETFLNGLISYRDGKLSEFNTQETLDAAEQSVVDADEALVSATTAQSVASVAYNEALAGGDATEIATAQAALTAADAALLTAETDLTTAQTDLTSTQTQSAIDFAAANAVQEAANTAIKESEDGIVDGMAELSMKQYRMETLSTRDAEKYATLGLDNTESLAADTTETIVELLNTQQAYQGAMQSVSKIMDLSLLNYI